MRASVAGGSASGRRTLPQQPDHALGPGGEPQHRCCDRKNDERQISQDILWISAERKAGEISGEGEENIIEADRAEPPP